VCRDTSMLSQHVLRQQLIPVLVRIVDYYERQVESRQQRLGTV
jgi:hypothetical protein